MTCMRTRLLLGLSLLAVVAARPSAQQPAAGGDRRQPGVTFRVEVNYVEVDAAVFDRQGRFVNDLTRDDFQVLEEGVPQEVSAFTLVNIPIEHAERPLYAKMPIEPDVASNAKPFEGRVYVIVLDDLQTAASRSMLVRRAARQFIEQAMAANDMAAIVYTSGRGEAGQEFTSSKRLLLASVDRFLGRKLRSTTLERLDQYQRQSSTGGPSNGSNPNRINDPLDMERGHDARASLDALKNISDYIGGIHGRRKAIVYLSEGIDYDVYDFNNREASTIQDSMQEVIASATRANVSIYGIDPRGLTSLAEDSIEASGGFPADPQLNLSMQSFQDELRLSQMSLRSLSEDTGGYAAVNSNDFTKAWDRVVADNSSYYVLGYYPKNEKRDGRFRKLDVKVRREGLEVRTRKGYTAPRGKAPATTTQSPNEKTSPDLRRALDSPLPLPALTLRGFAAPFKRRRAERVGRGQRRGGRRGSRVPAERRQVRRRPRSVGHRARLGREAPRRHARRRQHGTQAGNAGARGADRHPDAVAPQAAAGTLSVADGGARNRQRSCRFDHLRSRSAGLLEGAHLDERYRHRLCRRPVRDDREDRRGAPDGVAAGADRVTRVPRG